MKRGFCQAFTRTMPYGNLEVPHHLVASVIAIFFKYQVNARMTSRERQRGSSSRNLRLSCDRCHETKSRCARANGCHECERCCRLGNVCIYSPSLPMGRPKEKEVNFNTSFEDHRVGGTDESRKRRKRKSRNSSVTNDVPLLESDNETNTPCSSSTSNITTTISQAVQIEDPTNGICEPWLHASWPNIGLDLDYTMHLPFDSTLPLQDLTDLSTKDCLQISDSSVRTLPNPHTLNSSKADDWKFFSNASNLNSSLSKLPQEQISISAKDLSKRCTIQLLQLQSDLYQFASDDQGGDSYSPSEHAVRNSLDESGLNPGNAAISNLGMILSITQRLIDILIAAMPPAALGLPLQDISSSVESGIAGDILGCNESANLNVQAPRKDYGYKPNIVTTLLIFATYSSLLIEYEKLVNFLTLSRDSNDKQDVSAPSLSPSLNLGSFKMTATSKLYVGTLLHVIKQMLEQLRKTFDTSFPMHKDLRLHDQHLAEDFELVDRSKEGSADSNFNSPVITAAHDILLEISKKEKQLTHILSTE